ncbi:MAG: PRC-barrel domain-containing protein [Rhodanobacteraceae bacterium]
MLRNLNDLQGYAIHAADDVIGRVKDFHIDDQSWVIRYYVVETGSWLASRKVSMTPMCGAKDLDSARRSDSRSSGNVRVRG